MRKAIRLPALVILFLGLISSTIARGDNISQVRCGDRVTLLEPLKDGLTYVVETPYGIEKWKDRDLYYIAAYGEVCTVAKSYGSEVLIYVPVMKSNYWFTILDTKHTSRTTRGQPRREHPSPQRSDVLNWSQ